MHTRQSISLLMKTLVWVFIAFMINSSFALTRLSDGNFYKSTSTGLYEINQHGSCRVLESTSSQATFIPLRSSPEWVGSNGFVGTGESHHDHLTTYDCDYRYTSWNCGSWSDYGTNRERQTCTRSCYLSNPYTTIDCNFCGDNCNSTNIRNKNTNPATDPTPPPTDTSCMHNGQTIAIGNSTTTCGYDSLGNCSCSQAMCQSDGTLLNSRGPLSSCPPPPESTTGPWSVGAWGSCSKTCGGGIQLRTVECYYNNCTGNRPIASQFCNSHTCPVYNDCTLDGVTVAHGDSRDFYRHRNAPNGESCTDPDNIQLRACFDGILSGDDAFRYATCTDGGSCTITKSGNVNWTATNTRGTTNGCRAHCARQGLVSVRTSKGRMCESAETDNFSGSTRLYWEDGSLRCYANGQRHDGDRSDKTRFCYCATDPSCDGAEYTGKISGDDTGATGGSNGGGGSSGGGGLFRDPDEGLSLKQY